MAQVEHRGTVTAEGREMLLYLVDRNISFRCDRTVERRAWDKQLHGSLNCTKHSEPAPGFHSLRSPKWRYKAFQSRQWII
jgi:hypothetical protein